MGGRFGHKVGQIGMKIGQIMVILRSLLYTRVLKTDLKNSLIYLSLMEQIWQYLYQNLTFIADVSMLVVFRGNQLRSVAREIAANERLTGLLWSALDLELGQITHKSSPRGKKSEPFLRLVLLV